MCSTSTTAVCLVKYLLEAKILTEPGVKSSLHLTISTIWKPFDIRFEEILDDMQFHRDIVHRELGLLHLKETLNIQDSLRIQAAAGEDCEKKILK